MAISDFHLMQLDPRALFDSYLEKLVSGVGLTPDQTLLFEYLKTLFIVPESEE